MEKNIYIHNINFSDLKVQEIPKLFDDSMKEFSEDPENENNIVYWFISENHTETQYIDTKNIPREYLIRLKHFLDSSQELVNFLIGEIKNNPQIDNLDKLIPLMAESQLLKNLIVKYEQSLLLSEIGFDETSNFLWKSESELIIIGKYFGGSEEYVNSLEDVKNYLPAPARINVLDWFLKKYLIEGLVLEQKEYNNSLNVSYYIVINSLESGERKELFNSSKIENYNNYLKYSEAQYDCIDKVIELIKNK